MSDHLETSAHIIQFALTPVFLLSGIASLLNVFTTRLWRIADHRASASSRSNPKSMKIYDARSKILICAVGLGALAGAMTCGAALVLFVGALGSIETSKILFGLFGGAMLLTIFSLAAFFVEILLAGKSLVIETAHIETAHPKTKKVTITEA